MKLHKPSGQTWTSLSFAPLRIYNTLTDLDTPGSLATEPNSTEVFYAQRSEFGQEQEADSTISNAEFTQALANVIQEQSFVNF